jgi:RNA-directed DNA polymerase
LEEQVKPAIEAHLAERGLNLSQEKTVVTHIKHGFTFLGQTFRKQGNVLHITPAKEGVLALIRKVGTLTRKYVSAPMLILVKKLNQALRG